MSSEKRFRVEPRSADGYFKVVDIHRSAYKGTKPEEHPDVVCKAATKDKADHICKCLNLDQLMGSSGSEIFATNPETLETIKTHDL